MTDVKIAPRPPYAFETLTIANNDVISFNNNLATNSERAFVSIEGGNLRYRLDGTNSSNIVGHLVLANGNFIVDGRTALKGCKMTANGANVTASVTYFAR
jgi:hypothetical protein